MLTQISVILAATFASCAEAHKILMAGDMTPEQRPWFYSVAESLSENPETDNVVYFLTDELEPLTKK